MKFLTRLVDRLIALAKRYPYTHLYNADGTCYMERYWLMPRWTLDQIQVPWYVDGYYAGEQLHWKPKPWVPFAFRQHRICTPDYDPHMHDHPWTFISLVERGAYVERRPITTEPCFGYGIGNNEEFYRSVWRGAGSIAIRRATDRHKISWVDVDTWTLVLVFQKRHWWGFYTPAGKIYYKDYPSVHNLVARSECATEQELLERRA